MSILLSVTAVPLLKLLLIYLLLYRAGPSPNNLCSILQTPNTNSGLSKLHNLQTPDSGSLTAVLNKPGIPITLSEMVDVGPRRDVLL